MGSLDDDLPKPKPPEHRVGEDLSRLSIDELAARIELLKTEIARIEAALDAKRASRASAAGFFKA